jgi:hypothetical protein
MVPKQRRDDGHRRLLRARHERPRSSRAADERDELTTFHVGHGPSFLPRPVGALPDCQPGIPPWL